MIKRLFGVSVCLALLVAAAGVQASPILDVTRLASPHSNHHTGVAFTTLPEEERTHNLSEMGPTDWVHWGFSSTFADRETRKDIATPWLDVSFIQPSGFNLTGTRGGPLLHDGYNGLQGYTWNPGDDAPDRNQDFHPGGSDPQVFHGWAFNPPSGQLDDNNLPIGDWGFLITTPAPELPSVLYLHTGVWSAVGDLTISLLDPKGQVVLQYTDLGRTTARNQYRVEFEAAGPDHELVIEWLFAENTHATGMGVVRLGGVALHVIPEPATMLMLASGLAGLWGLRRRRKV